ncbi:hypothetical protein ACTNED_00705 [Absicoccus porci]|uniref:hypothetical protein n=1 Tax=Absicoccus porci TaxID=2486576 RepID=UPI003F8B1493
MKINELNKNVKELIKVLLSCDYDKVAEYYKKDGRDVSKSQYALWADVEQQLTMCYLLTYINRTAGIDTISISDEDYWRAINKMRRMEDTEIRFLIEKMK